MRGGGGGCCKGHPRIAVMRVPYWAPRRIYGRSASGSAAVQINGPAEHGADRGGHLVEDRRRQRRVDREHDQRLPTPGITADLHSGDVDSSVAKDLANDADDARPVATVRPMAW